ncbi:hypothetical protein PLICRDRAFT_696304 [Plicaturopsis crispa FD-325 SS-3]|nr:hypothetical protein PLICRDRAFT_696304 [Plicaturopsis crispa FD-325 SS-3]
MGFFMSKSFDPEKDLPSLKGKVILVTGANSGIGYATVKHLARRGAKVYLGARNESRALAAIKKLQAEGLGKEGGEVVWARVDLGDPRDAKKCAEEFMQKETRLDVLVNNAGMLPDVNKPVQKTADGIVDSMVTNHFSPFVFTNTLLPLLKKTAETQDADVRIVIVASGAPSYVPKSTRFRNVDDYNCSYEDYWLWPSFRRYCLTKFCNVVWARGLQAHLSAEGSPIVVMSLHPGGVNTISHRLPFKRMWDVLLPYVGLTTPDKGAYTSAFAAAASDVRARQDTYRGAFLVPVGKIGKAAAATLNPELAVELWDSTEAILKEMEL